MNAEKKQPGILFEWDDIKTMVPHRYPFLLLDRVVSVEPTEAENTRSVVGKRVHAMKCFSGNEAIFQGHFPDRAVVPGVILIEVMAQAAMFCFFWDNRMPDGLLSKVERCRFRAQVRPGDVLDVYAKATKEKSNFFEFEGFITERFSGVRVCDARLFLYVLARYATPIHR